MRLKCSFRLREREIGEVATRQHGVISRRQLIALGFSREAIARRLAAGRLRLIQPGAYAVGHRALTLRGRWMAAVLSAGEGAVLSHRSAAALWGIRPTHAVVEITAPRWRRLRPGVIAHQAVLAQDEMTVEAGIPVTTAIRTQFDLAAVVGRAELETVINEAEMKRLYDTLSLADLIARYPGRRGVAVLRAILADLDRGLARTNQELERRFRRFARRHGLPLYEVNASVELFTMSVEVDCLWRRHRLIVELDGHASHSTRRAYERDRARDRALSVAGWRVVRITWRQLHDAPSALAADLKRLLDPDTRPNQTSASIIDLDVAFGGGGGGPERPAA